MSVLYLDAATVSGIAIDRGRARRAVIESFAAYHRGEAKSRPKSSIEVATGHLFQTMIAASEAQGLVATKWLGMAPAPGSGGAHIDAMMLQWKNQQNQRLPTSGDAWNGAHMGVTLK